MVNDNDTIHHSEMFDTHDIPVDLLIIIVIIIYPTTYSRQARLIHLKEYYVSIERLQREVRHAS